MKKYFVVLLAALLLMALPIAAYATTEGGEIAATEGVEVIGPVVDGESAEMPTGEKYASEGWFAGAKAWLSQNFSGLAVAIAALYAVFPKWGGIAALSKIIKSALVVIAAFKKYMDDQSNPNSIYNVMARQGDAMSKFMNDLAPVLQRLQEGIAKVEAASKSQDKLSAVLLAVEEAEELMAKEFSDLISISTTISQKHKAELEEAFLKARAHLHVTVKEALGDDGEAKEAAA